MLQTFLADLKKGPGPNRCFCAVVVRAWPSRRPLSTCAAGVAVMATAEVSSFRSRRPSTTPQRLWTSRRSCRRRCRRRYDGDGHFRRRSRRHTRVR